MLIVSHPSSWSEHLLRVLLELLTSPEPQPGGLLLQELPSPLLLEKTQLLAYCGKRSVLLDDTGSMDLGGHGERERFEKEQGLWFRNSHIVKVVSGCLIERF